VVLMHSTAGRQPPSQRSQQLSWQLTACAPAAISHFTLLLAPFAATPWG